MTPDAPLAPASGKECPHRIEVERDVPLVPAATVKAWVAHLRSHGWTDKELDLVWLTRARHGVTR
ncbi:MAG TPA: hypothetical protein VJA45_05555 [Methylomirabilota bacterium]|jgi:hypothetical protein|nr:hypothetical protein [Methylomirabilota bacterium]